VFGTHEAFTLLPSNGKIDKGSQRNENKVLSDNKLAKKGESKKEVLLRGSSTNKTT
jgi:hypothetical protein